VPTLRLHAITLGSSNCEAYMKLTKTTVEKLPIPDDKTRQIIYRDSKLKGFAVRVTNQGAKSFVVEKRINRKNRRITIGSYGQLTVEQARKEAMKLLGKMATGIDPVAEDRAERTKRVTLGQAFSDYLDSHRQLTKSTTDDYKRSRDGAFKDWQNKPLIEITKDLVETRHRSLGRTSKARANNAMRVLRAIFNYAMDKYDDMDGNPVLHSNPVSRLSRTRGWFRVERRRTLIKPHQLNQWYQATLQLRSETARDYLHLSILTGLRRGESAKMTWNDVDFEDKTITIRETKNKEIHILPLTDFLLALLLRRHQNKGSLYVFPSESKAGHFTDPKSAINRVIDLSNVEFCMHDLRRTFITVAESLDIPAYALKRLLNHKWSGDVTAGYIVPSVDRLREPMQRITDYFMTEFNHGSNIAYIRQS